MEEPQTSSTQNQEPERLAAVLAKNVELCAEVVNLRTDVDELRVENKFLREKLDKLARRIFGTSREPSEAR
jgi:predicted ATP-grasp superfamily ATP-dependent carboligase